MEEFRQIFIEKYGTVKVNKSGTEVISKTGVSLSLHWRNNDGYVYCKLSIKDGNKKKYKRVYVHRLVAIAFVQNPNGYLQVNHIDGNKENNSASNLEWCTRQYNVKHAWDHGLVPPRDGQRNPRHKTNWNEVAQIRQKVSNGQSLYSIAKQYGLGWTTVSHIVRGDTWKAS